MKIKKEYILRKVAGENMVVPVGNETKLNPGIFQLNEAGMMLFELFQNGCEISDAVEMLVRTYNISNSQASEDVDDFVKLLNNYNLFE